jgi:hypothetical protein
VLVLDGVFGSIGRKEGRAEGRKKGNMYICIALCCVLDTGMGWEEGCIWVYPYPYLYLSVEEGKKAYVYMHATGLGMGIWSSGGFRTEPKKKTRSIYLG